MQINHEDYRVSFDAESKEVLCQGSLMLAGTEEYAPILELLKQCTERSDEQLCLNISGLDFINSSGINTMTKFIILARNQKSLQLTVVYTEEQPWQIKLASNLQRLMPSLQLQKLA